MTFFSKNPTFDKIIDKATSHLLLEPDWASNMTACDMIRQGEVTGKYAIQSIKKKLNHTNPHVVLYTLNLVETMAKNCGSNIHDEIASQDFMTVMKNLVKEKEPVKSKALELIQLWANAFRNQSKYNNIQTTYVNLKSSGHTFPPIVESDAMFMSENAPEWQDSDCCYRCKVIFSTLRRKHHCRNCGNIFCDECTSKRCNIPKYGIEKDVRVCDGCYDQLKGTGSIPTTTGPTSRHGRYKKGVQFNEDVTVRNIPTENKNQEAARLQKERELELQEKEELELALALSASEAETKGQSKGSNRVVPPAIEQPTPNDQSGFNGIYSTLDTSEMDPELARYLNRNYWENKASTQQTNTGVKITQPSAPILPTSPTNNKQSQSVAGNNKFDTQTTSSVTNTTHKSVDFVSPEQDEFLSALKSSIEIFVNRMQSNKERGRSIANDSSVQTLFLTLNAMHPQLLQYINDQDDKRTYYESLQDKLVQLRDAREALDALREEHREKRRREEEEAARIRQLQMMQKLEAMRQKKKQYLDYQRQLAVDRMQQQEREMAVKLAQQQQQMQMRQYQQQFPYSMQQQQQPGNTNAPDSNMMPSMMMMPQDQQQQPQQQSYTNIPNPNVPLPNQYDFYNMQGMSQTLPNSNVGVTPVGNMNYAPPPNNNPMAGQQQLHQIPPGGMGTVSNTMYQNMPPSQNQPPINMDLHNQSQPPNNEPAKKEEDQLISFD